MMKRKTFSPVNCLCCRSPLPCAFSLSYDIKGLVLSPFGNASFAGVSEKEQEVKKP
jgi:hypothetical protein